MNAPRRTQEASGHGWARRIQDTSSLILRAERLALMALMGLLALMILLNVATRYSGVPISRC